MRIELFVGFQVVPEDFLEEEQEIRRIDCGHDVEDEAKFCNECGTKLTNEDTKVVLKDAYRNQFDPPDRQYQSIMRSEVVDWLEFKAIRSNFEEMDTEVPPGSRSVVVGRWLTGVTPEEGGLNTVSPLEVDDALSAARKVRDELDLEKDVEIVLVGAS